MRCTRRSRTAQRQHPQRKMDSSNVMNVCRSSHSDEASGINAHDLDFNDENKNWKTHCFFSSLSVVAERAFRRWRCRMSAWTEWRRKKGTLIAFCHLWKMMVIRRSAAGWLMVGHVRAVHIIHPSMCAIATAFDAPWSERLANSVAKRTNTSRARSEFSSFTHCKQHANLMTF